MSIFAQCDVIRLVVSRSVARNMGALVAGARDAYMPLVHTCLLNVLKLLKF